MHKAFILSLLLCCGLACLPAQAKHAGSSAKAENCYDASDKRDIRLWDGTAPGALGDDPCTDIPYLRIYPAQQGRGAAAAGTAILVIPGGGYDNLSNRKEQEPVAEYFSQKLNATAFVLYYRLATKDGTYRYPVPMWDGQRALKWIRAHAGDYGIDPTRIGAFGFSAGGHLASTLALYSASDFNLPQHDAIDGQSGKLDFLGLGYPVISMDPQQYGNSKSREHLLQGYRGTELAHLEQYLSGQKNVSAHMPPVFLFVSMDDQRIDPQNSVVFADALKSAGIASDIHLFPHGAHGVGLATDVPEESGWPEMFHRWLVLQRILQ